ncbi:MAG: hypothetical protein Q9207_007242 [Kuettlingeria erythrocarpa]
MGTARLSVAIAEFIIYCLLFPNVIYLTYRHGIYRAIGFFSLCVFCTLRIAAAGLGIASENNRRNRENFVWSEILGSVGIGPLLLTGFYLLIRLYDLTPQPAVGSCESGKLTVGSRTLNSRPPSLGRHRAIQALHIPNTIALALAVIGGVDLSSFSPSQQAHGKWFSQAGISMFMAVFLLYATLCVITAVVDSIDPVEKCILIGLLAATPFLFIRMLYAMLAVFRDRGKFAILNGSATTQLGMGILQEIIVVLIYVATGFIAPVEKKDGPSVEEQPMRAIVS